MAYSVKNKLVLAATLPALLTTIIITFLALNDMHAQRDQLAQASQEFIKNQANGVSPEAMSLFIQQQWQSIFDAQAVIAIPGIIVIAGLLVIAALYLVSRITSGLNKLVSGVETMSNTSTPLSFRISTHNTSDMTPLANQLNTMMERVEHVIIKVRDISNNLHSSAEILRTNAKNNQSNSENLFLNMDSVSVAMTELESASSEIASNVQAAQSLSESFKLANEEILTLFNRLELVNNMNAQIATASEEQTQVISSISQTTESAKVLSQNTQQSSSSTGEQAEALIATSNNLKEMITEFNFS
jgi:methyl-accepting chemotaxis protein